MTLRRNWPARHDGRPCGPSCEECVEYGVHDTPHRRVPADPDKGLPDRWIHGRELREWLDAEARWKASVRAAIGPRGRRNHMERLAKEPGDED